MLEMYVTKYLQRNTQTHTDRNSKRYIPSMPIGMWGYNQNYCEDVKNRMIYRPTVCHVK